MRTEASAPRSRAARQFRGIVQLRGLTSATPRTIPASNRTVGLPYPKRALLQAELLTESFVLEKHGSDRASANDTRAAHGRPQPARNDERIRSEAAMRRRRRRPIASADRCAFCARWRWRGSNPRPSVCQTDALPTELRPLGLHTTSPESGRDVSEARAGLEPAPPGLQPSARTRYATEPTR